MNFDQCTALITGASSGLGAEFARQLAGRAKLVVLVARRQGRLEESRAELLKINPKLEVQVRVTDLSKGEELDALCDWLEEKKIGVDLLINNAGLGDHGSFATGDAARIVEMLEVNIVALTRLTHRLLPEMIARKRGAILNVSSSASFLPMAKLGVYAASKAYVTSFSEALGTELSGSGVSVTALCPGPVRTEFGKVATRPDGEHDLGPAITYVSAEKVVHVGLAAAERGQAIAIPGLVMKIGMFFVRITPLAVLRLAGRITR